MEPVIVYTDGSCNNKKTGKGAREGGFGIALRYEEYKKDYHSDCYTNTTSARMELMGVIKALELCNPGYDIEIYCDNKYVIDTANEWLWNWLNTNVLGKKANSDLWLKFIVAYERHGSQEKDKVKFIWTKGHAGTELNELADELANKGRLSEKKIVDERR